MKTYKMTINGNKYEVAVNNFDGTNAEVEVNGKTFSVELEQPVKAAAPVIARPTVAPTTATPAPAAAATPRPAAGGAAGAVRSPLPGVVLSINATPGSAVKAGQVILVLEAMKMENNIMADKDGTLTSVFVNKGDSVLEGAELFAIG